MLRFDWCIAHKKELIAAGILVLVLFLIQWMDQREGNQRYIWDADQIVGLMRQEPDESESFPLTAEVDQKGEKITYDVTITMEGEGSAGEEAETGEQKGNMQKSDSEHDTREKIDQLVETMQVSDDKKISLPDKLPDGTPVSWSIKRDDTILLTLLLFPLMIYFLYRSEQEKERSRRKAFEETVRKSLPVFNDQLLLMLNCGLIFHDAFYRISTSREQRKEQDDFCLFLSDVKRETDETGQSVVTVMRRKSQQAGVRELSRIVNIICDNQHRGVGLQDKLESESRLLWEERKLMAMRKGKEVETKLTVPLVLLLVVLMIITGVPAMMNM